MRQDLQLNSCAYWLMFQLLLHAAPLQYTYKGILHFYGSRKYLCSQVMLKKKESLNVEFELTNLCFKRDIPQIHFEHLVDN